MLRNGLHQNNLLISKQRENATQNREFEEAHFIMIGRLHLRAGI